MKVKPRAKQIRVFGIGLPLLLMFLAWRHSHKAGGVDALVVSLMALAVVSITLFIFFRGAFERFFDGWMKIAEKIGWVVTSLVLVVMYFIVFTPVSIILRLTGKDFMARTWDNKETSYWIACKQEAGTKDKYLDQF